MDHEIGVWRGLPSGPNHQGRKKLPFQEFRQFIPVDLLNMTTAINGPNPRMAHAPAHGNKINHCDLQFSNRVVNMDRHDQQRTYLYVVPDPNDVGDYHSPS